MSKSREKVTISLKYLGISASGKAIKVTEDGKENHWLPVSQIDYDEDIAEEGKVMDVTLPLWLKEEKGFA